MDKGKIASRNNKNFERFAFSDKLIIAYGRVAKEAVGKASTAYYYPHSIPWCKKDLKLKSFADRYQSLEVQ